VPHDDVATWIGALGVTLLLLAFLLSLLRAVRQDDWSYLALNLAGAALACWSSWRIQFMPFVVLEGTWAVVALGGLVRKLRGGSTPETRAA
jgi:uncharacterized membrane protein